MKRAGGWSSWVVATLAIGFLLAACSGGDEGEGTTLAVETTLPDPAADDPGEADASTVEVEAGGDTATVETTADETAADDPAADESGSDDPAADATATDEAEGSDGTGEAAEGDGATTGGDGATTGGGPAAAAAAIEALEGDELEEFLARRYEAFWSVFGSARENPTANPAIDVPALADLAVGEQLEAAYAELEDMAAEGRALRDPADRAVPGLDDNAAHRIRIEQVDGGSAELVACFVNDRESIQVADGAVISDLVITVKAQATMVRTDGTWKLVRSQAVALDQGVGGCWLEDESLYPW